MKPCPDRTEFESPPSGRIDRWRDRLAWRLANWVFRHIATPWYEARIRALVLIGIGRVTRPQRLEEIGSKEATLYRLAESHTTVHLTPEEVEQARAIEADHFILPE